MKWLTITHFVLIPEIGGGYGYDRPYGNGYGSYGDRPYGNGC